ncbi:MAG: hypothetical protein PHY43_13265 [Verrucomicrobiales bacterium]|nr:hypothetical protein [Verrucomicrobiales bacterium]
MNEDRTGILGINIQPGTMDIALANWGGHFPALKGATIEKSKPRKRKFEPGTVITNEDRLQQQKEMLETLRQKMKPK